MTKPSSFKLVVVVVVVICMAEGRVEAVTICGMDSSELAQCLPAVRPPSAPPTTGCCTAMHHTDLHCLCNFKSVLPGLGIDPRLAMALPKKCDLAAPPECGGV